MRHTDFHTNRLLLAVALLFHLIGVVGIGILHAPALLRSTPLHLLLMAALLVASFRKQIRPFAVWVFTTALVCFGAEWIGVHYGWLFGGYTYGAVLGLKWQDIPLVIGLNWALVAAGAITLAERMASRPWLVIMAAATLATGYDALLEPIAVRLSYWHWTGGPVPAYNYLCWWALSALAAAFWMRLRLRGNLFAGSLFLLQILFFIALRILL